MPDVYIVSAVRTPIGRFGGSLKSVKPQMLGAIAIKEALRRANTDPSRVELTIMGNVLRSGHGQDLARQAALLAGIPWEVDGYCVDMVCSSGMMGVTNAAQMIKSGDADVVVAGGMESMSQSMLAVNSEVRWGVKFLSGKSLNFIDTMLVDGLTDPFNLKLMGQEADMVARERDISRRELDEVAFESHRRAHQAWEKGLFKSEVIPVNLDEGKLERDEGIRPDTTMEKLSSLKPAFTENGYHTAGNSSQISDGAVAMVLMSEKAVKEFGVDPVAKILGYSWVGIESWRFTEAPLYSVRKLLTRLNMNITQFDYFENNEAFAVNNVLFHRYLGVPYDQLNVFGGAIALGHPIGASGARIMVTLLNVLSKMNATRGIASICHGVGGSTAIALELLRPL
ncbi:MULTISPECIES: thiolase family protein [Metallosphaera]|uniref:Acetyl-CoA acetyltransferase n=3 Tax=Metallosphaera TaxID=41980 RepID=A4YEH9_METS5|nr:MULTISPECIES: thiolase family protein [Metallosphaera]ABP94831.1 acetyl-CoA acetyltransferase [Metallosphaera sedula DSM 5348]AIM26818.1 acetyl-CoA acetyltransferase [Metallosphaera sedula]AKV73767.1 acetyl-CoA acetyltransferase [Metallosphaera sedula]AKV76007.1 acetyl-CoA acetyltransferase [Metallosphaera sedula]AKV78258.1 acetyl-CoA acetyltransferase [Metallosphaera sedula]